MGTTALDLSQLQTASCLGVARRLSGRVLPGSQEQNELWQLLGTWEGAAPAWDQPAMGTDLLAGSPALLHYHCELNTNT